MGGYEGADHVNGAGQALDLVAASGHDLRLDADYRAARRLGLRCLRESIGWRLAEPEPGRWDFSRAIRMAEAAERQGVQILWTLMHYGVPPDLTLFDDALIPRFARFAGEVARTLRPLCPGPRIYTPINEISFLSWIASATPDMGPAGRRASSAHDDSRDHGYLFKQRLVRAALAGMDAIRAEDPQARFLHIEPVVHVVAPNGSTEHSDLAEKTSSYQWQALDMMAGRMDLHLGGHPEALDLVGLNHYHNSQWEVPSQKRLEWHLRDPRRMPLADMLSEVWQRYGRPVVVAETGHVGVGRAAWLNEIAGEARRARARGVPLEGVCLYPLLDRPDWNDTRQWHRSGLWHLPRPEARRLNRPYARALMSWQQSGVPAPRTDDDGACLLVLLPCAWEDWRVPREQLLAGLDRISRVCLIEPPRASTHPATVRVHSLSRSVDLVILHGQGAAGWAEIPTPGQLKLLRGVIPRSQRLVCWLAEWAADGNAAWWREFGDGALVAQPAAGTTPAPELLRRADAVVPSVWPMAAGRRRMAPSYESDEIGQLLSGIPAPRAWLLAPSNPASYEHFTARLLPLAIHKPDVHWLIDAPAPAAVAPWPSNTHWLGRVHDSLHATLASSVQQVLPWCDQTGWTGVAEQISGTPAGDGMEQLLRQVVDLCAQKQPSDRYEMPIVEEKWANR